MRPLYRLLSLWMAALAFPGLALAQTEQLSGSVVAGYEVGVTAPFGGTVATVNVREGQWVEAGDSLATIATTKVYAPADGTISALSVKEGDSVSGTVLTLQPVRKYTITANVSEIYGTTDPERNYIHLGETLYIRCVKDRSHIAVGVVTATNGGEYTVETTGGELYLEEEVNLYREDGYSFASWVGTGTVARTPAMTVEGEGSLAYLHVTQGQEVERGQLLFETVTGTLDAYTPEGNEILSPQSGVLAGISLAAGSALDKDSLIATIQPRDGFELAVVVPEDMITYLKVGDTLRFYLDWDESNYRWYEGVVSSLSYVSVTTAENTTTFTAYLDFEPDETVRLGMTAVVEVEVP